MHILRYLLVTVSIINLALHASDDSELLEDTYSPWQSASLMPFEQETATPSLLAVQLACPSSGNTYSRRNKRVSPSCSSYDEGDRPLPKYQKISLSKKDLANIVSSFDLQVLALTCGVSVLLQELERSTSMIEQTSFVAQLADTASSSSNTTLNSLSAGGTRREVDMEKLAQEWMLELHTPITTYNMPFKRSLECIERMLAQIPDTTSLLWQRISIAQANYYLRECQKKQNQNCFHIAQEYLNKAKEIIPSIKPEYLKEYTYGTCKVPRATISHKNLIKRLKAIEKRQNNKMHS